MFSVGRYFVGLYLFFYVLLNNSNAATVNYALEGGIYSSDNITRTETAQLKDTVYVVGAELQVTDQSTNNDVAFLMDIERREYKNDTFTNDTRGTADLQSEWGIIERSLTWTVNGFYGQARIDPFAVVTPNNLQNVGFITTGPNLSWAITGADTLDFSAHYTDYDAEISDTDYTANTYRLAYIRRISSSTSLSLNTNYSDVSYDNTNTGANTDFTRTDYFLNFTRATPTNDISLNYGTSELDLADGRVIDGDFKQANFIWRLNRNNTFQVDFSDQIDNGAANVNGGNIGNAIAAGNLSRNQRATLGYGYVRDPVQVNVQLGYADEDFTEVAQNDFDRKIRTGSVNLIFGQPQNLQFTIAHFYTNFDFYIRGQNDIENSTSLRLSRRIFGNVLIGVEGLRFNRESTTLAQTQDITENQLQIFVRYQSRNR